MLSTVYKNMLRGASNQNNVRYFYRWLILIFNEIDEFRVKQVGPDRACAEWLLRNGASIRWKGSGKYLKNYNHLPGEYEKHYLEAIDATDSAIHHIGFRHFIGCKYINEIKLIRCCYIENDALPLLSIINDSLYDLEVVECYNITDEALLNLKSLTHLKRLKLGGFPYIKDHFKIKEELIKAMPNCNVAYDGPKE